MKKIYGLRLKKHRFHFPRRKPASITQGDNGAGASPANTMDGDILRRQDLQNADMGTAPYSPATQGQANTMASPLYNFIDPLRVPARS